MPFYLALALLSLSLLFSPIPVQAQGVPNSPETAILNQSWQKGDYKTVEKEALNAIQNGSSNPLAYHYLARAQAQRGNVDAATKTLTTLIAKHPNYAPSYLTYAKIFESQGKAKEAKDFYRMYVEKSGGNIPKDPGLRLKLRDLGLY